MGFTRLIRRAPRNDLSIENHAFRQSGQRRWQLREPFGNLIPRARKEASLPAANVSLRPNAVVFILNRRVLKIADRLFRGFHRTRQHEIDRMKKSQPSVGQLSLRCEPQSFANVAEQHVGALHLIERRVESLRNSLFHQAFFQTDAQVSTDDFYDVLGSERRGALEQLPQQGAFSRGAARASNLSEGLL